ncbi:3-keto-disaccharide hydrolase [Lacipirellula sp.]|uniref:3-keto-disaccharide hydrolase n=1 Tax=Lacipirellula sp. TaxID=2691419 RepID=UPI003D0F6B07
MVARLSACLAVLLMFATVVRAAENVPPKGFVALFDGKDLKGWKGGSTADPKKITPEQQAAWDADVPKHWSVDDGELVSDGHGPHLVTDKNYGNFELWVDWKLSPKGDSGIYLRDTPQVQLWDPTNNDAHQHGSDKGSGGLWNNQKAERWPSEVADKPIGEWNRMYVRMVGDKVTVVLNDKKVVDNVVLENYFDRALPMIPEGTIQLQTHGSETRFKNVFVREIPAEEAAKLLSDIGGGEEGFVELFNGKDLTGWIGATKDYEVVDGAIQAKKGTGGNLLTEKEYDNFVVRLEFKLPPGGNNGLAIRSPGPEKNPAYDAIELQVLDDSPEHYPDLHDYQAHGSAYGLVPAVRGYLKPVGEWNYQETVVDGDKIVTTLNGHKILDANLTEALKKPADGLEHPGATRAKGHFGFAGHSDPVAFRKVRIKELK